MTQSPIPVGVRLEVRKTPVLGAAHDNRWVWVASLAFVAAAVIASSNWRDLNDVFPRLIADRLALAHLTDLVALTVDAESAERGYLMTDDARYLERYNLSLNRLQQAHASLRADYIALHGDSALLAAFTQGTSAKFAEMASTLKTRETLGREAAFDKVRSNRDKALMESMRAQVQQISLELAASQNASLAAAQARALRVFIGTVFGLAVLFSFFLYAHASLKRQTRVAIEASRAKSEFLASMSHELRTPLNAIIGYSALMKEQADISGAQQFVPDLDRIESSGKHLLGLINSILDLSRIEAGRMDLHIQEFALGDLAEELRVLVAPMIEQRRNQLHLELKSPNIRLTTDREKLKQTLVNLLSNAAKFTKNGHI